MEQAPETPVADHFAKHAIRVVSQYQEGAITSPELVNSIIAAALEAEFMGAVEAEDKALRAYYDERWQRVVEPR